MNIKVNDKYVEIETGLIVTIVSVNANPEVRKYYFKYNDQGAPAGIFSEPFSRFIQYYRPMVHVDYKSNIKHLCATCKYQQPQCNAVPLCDSITGLITECDKYSKEYCIWSNSEDSDENDCDTQWETSCGNDFILNDGTPENNGMKYCCYCGKPIEQLVRVKI